LDSAEDKTSGDDSKRRKKATSLPSRSRHDRQDAKGTPAVHGALPVMTTETAYQVGFAKWDEEDPLSSPKEDTNVMPATEDVSDSMVPSSNSKSSSDSEPTPLTLPKDGKRRFLTYGLVMFLVVSLITAISVVLTTRGDDGTADPTSDPTYGAPGSTTDELRDFILANTPTKRDTLNRETTPQALAFKWIDSSINNKYRSDSYRLLQR
jgi:hypothetical protein